MLKLKSLFLFAAFILVGSLFVQTAYAQPPTVGKFTIYGVEYTGDGLAPGWTNYSLYNGPNTWVLFDRTTFYAGTASLSWTASAPFEHGWIVSPTPLNLGQYVYLTFYAKATQIGQRYEVGFVNTQGAIIGNWVPIDSSGGPIQPDRWQIYNFPISTFGATAGAVYGIGFREMNGGQQPKVYFDEILLSDSPASAPVVSPGLGQPNAPAEPAKPQRPYYPNISPWVFIIPAVIIMLAIFFE